MCLVDKCCYFLPLDLGCVLLGSFTFALSLLMGIYSMVLLALEHSCPREGADHLKLMTHLELESSATKIVLSLIIMIEILWMFFSILLIVGIKKNHAMFVLCYFSFGIVVTILMMLSALLVLLNGHWIMTLFEFIAAMLYIHCLTVVHNTYEMMQRGKVFGLNQHLRMDTDQLIDPSA